MSIDQLVSRLRELQTFGEERRLTPEELEEFDDLSSTIFEILTDLVDLGRLVWLTQIRLGLDRLDDIVSDTVAAQIAAHNRPVELIVEIDTPSEPQP